MLVFTHTQLFHTWQSQFPKLKTVLPNHPTQSGLEVGGGLLAWVGGGLSGLEVAYWGWRWPTRVGGGLLGLEVARA